ncbi:MAG: c-type cytochrome, partial [Pirellulaceae bacterium]|nr:c-type cytochrome [Pirellulaceae bacterium]
RCGHSCPGKLGLPGTPNQLRVPIDGGVWRYHPQHKTVEVLCHGTTNPWGHDWDEYGELFFINTVIGHLWHMMPGAHLKESFGESMNPDVYQRLDMIADHYHFDTKGTWSDSRQGQANDFGGGHAHIGTAIYNGAAWPPAYRGKLMTINMHGQRINVERLERRGAGYIGLHEPDFMLAKDPFFRGLDLSVAPDGNMLVIDWSDIGECHEATGVHRTSGRIYKVIYDGAREQSTAVNPVVQRLQNAWQAYKTGELTQDSMRQMLTEQDEHLRVWGIRLLTDRWPLDTIVGPKTNAVYPPDPASIATFVRMAREDKSGLVKLVLASVLQRLPIDRRAELASELVQHREFADDRDLPLLVWYGLIPLGTKQPSALVDIARVSQWPKLNRWIARSLATRSAQSPESLEKLLQVATLQAEDFQQNTLLGLSDAFHGWRQAPQPKAWKEFARTPGAMRSSDELRKLNSLFGDGQALDEIQAIVRDNKAEMQTRQRALETLIAARPANLRSVCESLMDVRILNATAMRGLTLYDDPAIGRMLTQKYRRFQPDDRPAVLEALVSRRSYAIELLKGMAQKNSPIGPSELTAFHARQIRSLNDEDLSQQLVEVWGQLRETSADRRALIEKLKGQLTADTLTKADRSAGRLLYNKSCSQCHQLFGQGKKIGPDLTGAQRASLDYLLENVVDPSAVVGKDYRMSKVLTVDGRVLSGLLVSRTDKSLVVQTQSTLETLSAEDVEQVQATTLSAMPEGLLETLSPDQVRDLIAYLMTPTQVGL